MHRRAEVLEKENAELRVRNERKEAQLQKDKDALLKEKASMQERCKGLQAERQQLSEQVQAKASNGNAWGWQMRLATRDWICGEKSFLLMVSKVPDETRPNPQNGCVNALNKFPSHSCRLPHLTPSRFAHADVDGLSASPAAKAYGVKSGWILLPMSISIVSSQTQIISSTIYLYDSKWESINWYMMLMLINDVSWISFDIWMIVKINENPIARIVAMLLHGNTRRPLFPPRGTVPWWNAAGNGSKSDWTDLGHRRSHFIHRIGWWEDLQESLIFDGKKHGFL